MHFIIVPIAKMLAILYTDLYTLPVTSGYPTVSFGDVTITSKLNADPLTFNVTCFSTGGPVSSVAWTLNDSVVPDNAITTREVTDTVDGAYTLTLSAAGRVSGTCKCEVTALRPREIPNIATVSAEMELRGKYTQICGVYN